MKNKENIFLLTLSSGTVFSVVFSIFLINYHQLPRTLGDAPETTGKTQNVLASSSGSSVDFIYDAAGQRIAKIVEGGDHTYYISPNLEVVVHPDGTKSWRKNYYFNSKLVSVRQGDSASSDGTRCRLNHGKGYTCDEYCALSGTSCLGVGTDSSCSNLNYKKYVTFAGECYPDWPTSCGDTITGDGGNCLGTNTQWTYCKCGPEPTPAPTDTPTNTPAPTNTSTPTPTPTISIIQPIGIVASGTEDNGIYPGMELLIDDVVVATYTVTGTLTNYAYFPDSKIDDPSRIKVRFINDRGPRNLRVDYITINGTIHQTEASTTYSTGTWSADTGCGDGYKQSEWLHCNGYFHYYYAPDG